MERTLKVLPFGEDLGGANRSHSRKGREYILLQTIVPNKKVDKVLFGF